MKLRIAYCLHNSINPYEKTGAQTQLFKTLEGLRRAGHVVKVFMREGRRVFCTEDFSQREACSLGISDRRLFRTGESGIRRIQSELKLPYLSLFDNFRFYEACLNSFPIYDICHERNGLLNFGAAMAARRLNMPHVFFSDADILFEQDYIGKPIQGIQRKVAIQMARYTYKMADRIICVAEQAKQHLVEKWHIDPAKVEVLPNAVDVHLFYQTFDDLSTRAKLGISKEPIIMFVGSFFQWHDLDTLISAWPIVLNQVPNARLILVGDGMRRQEIEDRVRRENLIGSIYFTGGVPHGQIPALLSAADVLVAPYPRFTAPFWGSPMKIFEYMAAGKPIVASRVGQVAEILADGKTGRLVEPGECDQLAAIITELLQNKPFAIQLGEAARQQALSRHSWEHYISMLERIYTRALSKVH